MTLKGVVGLSRSHNEAQDRRNALIQRAADELTDQELEAELRDDPARAVAVAFRGCTGSEVGGALNLVNLRTKGSTEQARKWGDDFFELLIENILDDTVFAANKRAFVEDLAAKLVDEGHYE